MDPLRIYEYLTMARGRIFDVVRPLSAEQYAQQFPIGLGSLARTLTHIMICEWAYVQRIQRKELPPYETWPIQDEKPPPFAELEAHWTRQAADTTAALSAVRDWNEQIQYTVPWRKPPALVTATVGDIVTQLVLHEVHHRSQVMNMLKQLGAAVDDIDFNALMFDRQDAAPAG